MEGRIEECGDHFLWIIERYTDRIKQSGTPFSPYFNFDGRIWSLEINISRNSWINLLLKNYNDRGASDHVTLGLKVNGNYLRRNAVPDASGRNFTAAKVISSDELRCGGYRQILPGDVLTVFCKISTKELENEKKEEQHHRSKSISKLQQDLEELFSNDQNSDVILRVKERQFKAHRNILAARSSFFAMKFPDDNSNNADESNATLELEDHDPDTFSEFLHYLYTGSIQRMTRQNVKRLYTTAEKYRVWELQDECVEFMVTNMADENVGDFIRLGLRQKDRELEHAVPKCPSRKRKLSL